MFLGGCALLVLLCLAGIWYLVGIWLVSIVGQYWWVCSYRSSLPGRSVSVGQYLWVSICGSILVVSIGGSVLEGEYWWVSIGGSVSAGQYWWSSIAIKFKTHGCKLRIVQLQASAVAVVAASKGAAIDLCRNSTYIR